ncbi:MAG TPA: serine/threonine-protein kinase [Thermoanaerobaculia bacterium]
MKSERWQRVDELFASALELEGAARTRFLDEACANDATLRHEVETLLQLSHASGDFLETPLFHAATALLADDAETLRLDTPLTTTGAIDNARFVPGDLIAGRYRIAGLLGRGGMGEVYRADDLRLSQPVALKFLSESLARNGAALARFHREVSVARQISHRHVCRVYDIGEHAGMHFLSMEYIRGEELSSLLKRIGRLPADKALETARQLCAGLAAIHAAGVLHRDLKPANIMLDEHGNVRITDFGIVALAEGVSGVEAMVGTPAYMSPEQREGGELTTRSDLYSLGLVLHECFTGKRLTADTPSTGAELDPVVERVIARCLEKDPARRPASALQVAAALPGGDPLAAALAAGETPSPQMVAAAPTEGSLRPSIALLLLGWIAGGIVLIALLAESTLLHQYLPLPHSREVLAERAASLARTAGYTTPPADSVHDFAMDYEYRLHLEKPNGPPDRWTRLRGGVPSLMAFWYRQSPRPLEPLNESRVSVGDPPHDTVGMVMVQLDPEGRLIYFEAVPPQVDGGAAATADWKPFFDAAGVDMAAFRPTGSRWTPPQHSDSRLAWNGVHPARPDMPLRIEAAAYRGKPTYFDVIAPWRMPLRQELPPTAAMGFPIAFLVLYFGAITLAALLAWKNLRLGRGDRRGAFRLALFIFTTRVISWAFFAHHVATAGEVMGSFVTGLQSALYWACFVGLLHLALEPFVRRRWPEWLISWSRLLAGDVRDPLFGRDVLIGGAAGIAVMLYGQLSHLVAERFGQAAVPPIFNSDLIYSLGMRGARGFVPLLVNQTSAAVLFSFIVVSVLLFFAMVTRNRKVAIAVSWVVFYLALNLGNPGQPLNYALGVIVPTLFIVVLARYGLLALISTIFFMHLWAFYPVTADLSAWYATPFILQVVLLLAVTAYAFRTSLAGQRVVRAFDE